MRIISNQSPYETMAVRRILMLVYRSMRSEFRLSLHFWDDLRVSLHAGRSQRMKAQTVNGTLRLTLPPLKGDEFVGLLRQQHGMQTGMTNVAPFGLLTDALALLVQRALFMMMRVPTRRWQRRVLYAKKQVTKLPALVAIRVLDPKPEKPRDRVRESYDRVLVLERKWQTRAKLAATKLKVLRRKRTYYEKRLAARKEMQ